MQIDMKPIFRPAIPDEVEAAVPLMYSANPPTFDYIFKTNQNSAQDFMKYAFVRKGGLFSHQCHICAVVKDELVGIGSFYSGKQQINFTFVDGIRILSFFGLKGLNVAVKGLKVETIMPFPKRDEMFISNLGVAEKMRGKGIGTQLILHMLEEQKKANGIDGTTKVKLDVSDENPRAQALYERLGFEVIKTTDTDIKNEFGWVEKHHRMEHLKPPVWDR